MKNTCHRKPQSSKDFMEEEILAASLSSHLLVRKSWREEMSYDSHYEFITKVIIR